MAGLEWNEVTDATGVRFTDIQQNKEAYAYTTNQINILNNFDDNKVFIGDTVLRTFRGSNTGHLFYGESRQTKQTRADVTKDGDSVKIQIQLNTGTKGSPTFASLFVRNNVESYLKLDGVPRVLAQWDYDISNIERLIDSGTLQEKILKLCISGINEFIEQYNKTFLHKDTKDMLVLLDESLITNVALGPTYHGKHFAIFIHRLYDVQKKYASLRNHQIDYKGRMSRERKIELGKKF